MMCGEWDEIEAQEERCRACREAAEESGNEPDCAACGVMDEELDGPAQVTVDDVDDDLDIQF